MSIDTTQRIVYKDANGVLCVVTPAPEALQQYTILQIADKDVPHGLPYKIVTASDLPSDRLFRNSWDIDDSLLTDGVGAESHEFPTEE